MCSCMQICINDPESSFHCMIETVLDSGKDAVEKVVIDVKRFKCED